MMPQAGIAWQHRHLATAQLPLATPAGATHPIQNPYLPTNAKFLFTAKNVKLHSCLTFDSVGFTPSGGGNAPRGVKRKSPFS
jgi:hypothetical protein